MTLTMISHVVSCVDATKYKINLPQCVFIFGRKRPRSIQLKLSITFPTQYIVLLEQQDRYASITNNNELGDFRVGGTN